MDNGPYNPYANRDVQVPLTNLEAFFSLLKCIVGTGILAMPKAFYYAGILGGIMLTILSTIVLMYGMHLLIKCMVESARQQEIPYCTYSESMVYAFSVGPNWCKHCSRGFGFMVDLVLALSHYGVAVVYILFVAKNVQQLIHYHFSYYSLEIFVAVVGILLLPLFMVRQLKYLVPLNVLSNVLMYMGFLLIFYYLFRGLPSMSDRKMIGAFDELLEFFGIVFFAVTSVGVMLAIESKMATPEKYIGCFGILNIAAVIVVFSNLLFGVLGFWRYGDEIRSSVTLNLPSDTVVSQISKISIALGVFMTYPLSGYVTIDIIIREWVLKGRSYPHPHMIEYIVRVLFVFLSTINAMAFPKLSPLVALVGSVTISVLNLIFPAFIEMSLLYSNSYGRLKWILVKDILLVILGFSILVHGLYSGTRTMLRTYHPDYQDNQKCLNVSTKSTCQIDDL